MNENDLISACGWVLDFGLIRAWCVKRQSIQFSGTGGKSREQWFAEDKVDVTPNRRMNKASTT
jgi:hypothetical protein